MKRRAVLAGVPTALLLAGCTDLVTEGEVRFEADAAAIADAALEETGYAHQRTRREEIRREFEQVDRDAVVVNVMSEYSREIDFGVASGELARFTVLSTPTVEIGPIGPLNPVEEMDNEELADMVQEEYDEVESVEPVDDRTVRLLGEDVRMDRFAAEAVVRGGIEVEVYLHIAQVENEGDFVVTIAVHPQVIDERENVDRLVEGVEHPTGE